jgi:hypothetical protein
MIEPAAGITFMILAFIGPLVLLMFLAAKVNKNQELESACSIACAFIVLHMCGLAVWQTADDYYIKNKGLLPHGAELAFLAGTFLLSIGGTVVFASWRRKNTSAQDDEIQADPRRQEGT